MKKSDKEILKKIKSYCNEIEETVKNLNFEQFMLPENYKDRNSCAFGALQIGELSKKISQEIKENYPAVKWKNWTDIRNFMAHNYEGFDLNRAWGLYKHKIPELNKLTEKVLEDIEVSKRALETNLQNSKYKPRIR